MTLAYLNGRLIPAEQAVLPVYDAGFLLGATVAEQIRTFGGRLFRLEHHLDRLSHSLEIVGVDPGVSMSELAETAQELAARNHQLLAPGDDLGMAVFVTPGPSATMATSAGADLQTGPTICMHTYPLPFHLWVNTYQNGQSLVVTDVEQVPQTCWPADLKCRSRMHYYLADSQARQADPGSRALMLDHEGHVLEASTANIVVYVRGQGLFSPPADRILPGISVSVVAGLAEHLGIPFGHCDLTVEDVCRADEVMLCSTSPCVWPVARLNGRTIGDVATRPMARQLLTTWSELVDIDIEQQALQFARR